MCFVDEPTFLLFDLLMSDLFDPFVKHKEKETVVLFITLLFGQTQETCCNQGNFRRD